MATLEILNWAELSADECASALARPASSLDASLLATVRDILADVQRDGDAALRAFTARFDGVDSATLRVPREDIDAAWNALPPAQRQALTHARDNVRRFHAAQQQDPIAVEVQPGVQCRLESRAIGDVGLYIPGGTAPLPSAVIMLAVPAQIAGCARRVLCTPPQPNGQVAPQVLAAAQLCGIDEVYAVGGAQAIAALAYGTSSIARVAKIFGPGNAYVTAAKMQVSQDPHGAAVDMPAGPSEVLVIADADADAGAVAADLLAQAEHGRDSQVLLFTDSAELATAVGAALDRQIPARGRQSIIHDALTHSRCIVFDDLDAAIAASNRYAPEHLIVNTRDARERVAQISNAGSVFVGPWAAETFGDYCSGTNHVLPTYGFAQAYSGVSLRDFQKTISVQELSAHGFDALADTAITLAQMEGLDAHAAAVEIRQALRAKRGAA